MKLAKDLTAASATPLVLSLLRQGDSYGYELIKNVRELSGGELEWKEGMLYPLLHRLDQSGLIQSYSGVAENGRSRKYYRLLAAGEEQLVEQRHGFESVLGFLDSAAAFTPGAANV